MHMSVVQQLVFALKTCYSSNNYNNNCPARIPASDWQLQCCTECTLQCTECTYVNNNDVYQTCTQAGPDLSIHARLDQI